MATSRPCFEWTTTDAETGFYVYVRTTLREREAGYRDALNRDSVLTVTPVELRGDRTVRQTLVGHSDQLTAAVGELPDDIDVEILWTGRYRQSGGAALTARQRDALTAAWTVGYYEMPREADLDEVADRLDCATSTASDLLRRAERKVIADALGEQ